MIYFSLTLTFAQLQVLNAANKGELAPDKRESRTLHLSHFVTHANALIKNNLLIHDKKRGGFSITHRGKLVLELFKDDIAQAATYYLLTENEQKKVIGQ